MKFFEHQQWLDHDAQSADNCFICSPRHHIRFKQGLDADAIWGTYTSAAVHFEETHGCFPVPMHVAIDFDGPRDAVWNTMFQQNPVDHSGQYNAVNNNTNPSPQCDGSQPHSIDGFTRWIRVP